MSGAPGVPQYARALLRALRFERPDCADLQAMDDAAWRKLLQLLDSSQLTLTARQLCRDAMPAWVRERVDRDALNNSVRFQNATLMLLEIVEELERRGIDYTVLKGFTHSPDFSPDPEMRAQTDCDLWVTPATLTAAHAVLSEMGYVPVSESNGRHLPPMIRPSEWRWTGDYFATDLPIGVDLHYELWDEQAEKVPAPGEQDFWKRRVELSCNEKRVPALCPQDSLAFASMHLLLHIFHGDLRLHRAWEIARFLQLHADNGTFWTSWERLHTPELRRLQAVVFALVSKWFSCRLAGEAETEIDALPEQVQWWIEQLGWSPVQGLFTPNRDELWLRLALIDSRLDRLRFLRDRVIPRGNPASKALRRARSLLGTLLAGICWWWGGKGFSKGFLVYLAGSALFDAGAFIFVLLYNLFLLDHGFRAQLIGQVNGAMTAGTLAAAMPAAWICRRFGLRNALLIAIIGSAFAAGLRAVVNDQVLLIATAFLHGVFFSVWAVSYSPTIATFTNLRNRTLGFSIACSMGMSLGIGAGFVGGRLPAIFQSMGLSHNELTAKRLALLAAAALIVSAAIPIFRLVVSADQALTEEPAKAARMYPRTVFFTCFLLVSCIWSLATNAFNPFFNTYFVDRYHMPVERIGAIFSFSQLAQVVAVFLTPAILRRLGDFRGIAAVQLMTACMMAFLVPRLPPVASAAVFVAYMTFQYMTAPSLFSLIMSHVQVQEQSGASALNFVVTSLAAVAASFAAGAVIDQRGYAQLLAASALLAVFAAFLTWTLLPVRTRSSVLGELSVTD